MPNELDLEYLTETIPINEQFQERVSALAADGWEVVPGTQPAAIYHLVRLKKIAQAAGIGGFGSLAIDESKIHIIRGGKVVG
jgi:hypothetical protein